MLRPRSRRQFQRGIGNLFRRGGARHLFWPGLGEAGRFVGGDFHHGFHARTCEDLIARNACEPISAREHILLLHSDHPCHAMYWSFFRTHAAVPRGAYVVWSSEGSYIGMFSIDALRVLQDYRDFFRWAGRFMCS